MAESKFHMQAETNQYLAVTSRVLDSCLAAAVSSTTKTCKYPYGNQKWSWKIPFCLVMVMIMMMMMTMMMMTMTMMMTMIIVPIITIVIIVMMMLINVFFDEIIIITVLSPVFIC